MQMVRVLTCALAAGVGIFAQTGAQTSTSGPLRVAIIGLAHGHVGGFLNGGALTPAGGALHRPDVQVVAIVDPERALFDKYATRNHLSPDLYFTDINEMISRVHPQAALVFTSTYDHTRVVEECARHGIHVMMEKPLAVSYADALRMEKAAQDGHVHVLVDYETSWYASNKAAHDLLASGALGEIRKVVVHDGHEGPKAIHTAPEFFAWLTDPKLNGAGALYDFGCYGADLMTWLMKGEAPTSVTAVTQTLQPETYPKVDDEANVILAYPKAVAILQGSWNWPYARKDMEVYGVTGSAKTIAAKEVNVREKGDKEGHVTTAQPLQSPYDDPLHLLAAVIRGDIQEENDLSGIKTNVLVSEILDAARRSAKTGKTVTLPLHD